VHFATKRRISIAEKKKLDIRLDFKQYAFNETVSFPFSIPKNYSTNN
jgi:outer membrane lipoprotein-sorting protein